MRTPTRTIAVHARDKADDAADRSLESKAMALEALDVSNDAIAAVRRHDLQLLLLSLAIAVLAWLLIRKNGH